MGAAHGDSGAARCEPLSIGDDSDAPEAETKGGGMFNPADIEMAAKETCQSVLLVHLVAMRLGEIWDGFTTSDLIGEVTYALELAREANN